MTNPKDDFWLELVLILILAVILLIIVTAAMLITGDIVF
jgi:hypothetical protein